MNGNRGLAVRNVLAVARREFLARAATRTFLAATAFLALAAAVVGLAPVLVDYVSRDSTRVAVYVGAADLRGDPIRTLDTLLNTSSATPGTGSAAGSGGDSGSAPAGAFVVTRATDLDASRRQVLDGKLSALLDIERAATGDLEFTVYANDPAASRTAIISRQAASSIAIADRLARSGLSAAEQAGLFVAPEVTVRPADLSKPASDSEAEVQRIADVAVGFGLEMFLLLAIVLYGNWVAQSVVEEKSSRMMEIVLVAASPFQLLAGKVLGVSAAALLQFSAVLVTAIAAILVEGRVASAILGDSAGLSLPSGLTPALIVTFSILFVLGFTLYAALFAAAGSLVSRQEDVNQVVTPMTLVASAGFLIATYSSIGTLNPNAPWFAPLSWVPFFSPYMMVSRVNAGSAGPAEIILAVVLLAAAIVASSWVAARIYAAGVLLYGQKPSVGRMWAAIRAGR